MLGTISTGAAGSWQMSNNGPDDFRDYAPGFFIKHFVKDLRIALRKAKNGARASHPQKAENVYANGRKGQGDLGTQAIIERYGDDC